MVEHYRYNSAMPVKRVLAKEAADLMAEGWKYVDVRSIPEFERGHPAGSYNVPLVHVVPGRGRMPNDEFEAVMGRRFGKGDKLLLGCATGQRSLRAAEILLGAGWTDVVDVQPGFEGERDIYGRVVSVGWRDSGLPVETEAPGRTWEDLRRQP
jgi:rhodanese-related sulfurtransferase